ncbi:cytochrome P450 [Streptomyces scopuliridis]|uniref:cytochrome P450 n=1 Tax=Streptomyces scopuliridis TaxID=452529 RepID=UPI002DD80007|nr:cytochrome P450 [Streptomyces scopuliridis]WSB37467.1 cytochrome P450 [Streptomyces scopuliridis]
MTTTNELPSIPGTRDSRCPFAPPAEYTDWRESDGLRRVTLRNGQTAWAVNRFEDIRAVLSDPTVSADGTNPNLPKTVPVDESVPLFFQMKDDPEHARLRKMLTKHFTVKRVNELRPRIQRLADEHLDQMISKGHPADLVRDFALPIPSLVISLMLGVPYSDHDFFQRNSTAVLSADSSADEQQQATGRLFGYLLDLLNRRESEPGDDILSQLLTEHVATGELTREEAAMNGVALLVAGHETTAKMITLGTLVLLRNPDQLARVRDTDDQAVIAGAVEELLRYITFAEMITRVATEDITVGGQVIKAGEGIALNLLSGNHDPSFFKDPGAVDVDRNARGHVAFGFGVHQCLGQPLARAELQIALSTLLRRLPGLRLAVPFEQVTFRDDIGTNVRNLPVAW